MYAFMETGGRQFKVSVGDDIAVPLLSAEAGAEVRLEKVLAVVKDGKTVIGSPYVQGAAVTAEVLATGKDKKVFAFKKRPRKVFKKLRGHRQDFTALRIKEIQGV